MAGNRAFFMNFPSLPSDRRMVLFLFRLKLQRMNVRWENWSVKTAISARGTSHGNGGFVGLQCVKTGAANLTLDVTLLPLSRNMKQMINTFPGSSTESFSVFFLHCKYLLAMTNSLLLKMTIEELTLPWKMLIFHSYVSVPLSIWDIRCPSPPKPRWQADGPAVIIPCFHTASAARTSRAWRSQVSWMFWFATYCIANPPKDRKKQNPTKNSHKLLFYVFFVGCYSLYVTILFVYVYLAQNALDSFNPTSYVLKLADLPFQSKICLSLGHN